MKQGSLLEDFGLSDPSKNTMSRSSHTALNTVRSAAKDTSPRSGSWQARSLEKFIEAGAPGLTDYELAVALERAHMRGAVAKHRGALRDGGWVEDTGRVRRTDTGSRATVWALTDKARRYLKRQRHS